MAEPPAELAPKLQEQIRKAGLPPDGRFPYRPKIAQNRRGDDIIEKATVMVGPKAGKRGWVDAQDRIWLKDRAHAGDPDHWDVQTDGGREYVRIGMDGNPLPSRSTLP